MEKFDLIQRIETAILSNLIYNEDYSRKVLPFIKKEYFQDFTEETIFNIINNYISEYNSNPEIEAVSIELQKFSLTQEQYKLVNSYITENIRIVKVDLEWLVNETEKWCKDKAIYNAILEGIHIIDGKSKTKQPDSIPSILSEALSVSFDTNVGHDYLEQAPDRYDFYNEKVEKIPFNLDFFNKITKGGLPNKSISIIVSGTGVGKSLFMCHHAANVLMQGKNVLYITLEMAEQRIAERIDANLMNISMNDLHDLPKPMYESKIEKIRKKTQGKLIVKEYPTTSAGSSHFKSLLNELELKRNFKPDMIFVDYLNICASSRLRADSIANSYVYVKSIAEELRGLAVEYNLPIMTATQVNRTGFQSSDFGMENVSESFGINATADLMFALISTEEMEKLNQLLVKQLKNRYNDPTSNKKFVIGVDRSKMKLYDVSQKGQKDLVNTGQSEPDSIVDRFANFKI